MHNWPDLSLDEFGKKILQKRESPPIDVLQCLFTGFYPRIHDKKLVPREWLKNYSQTYLERDVREIINVGDLEVFHRFMGLCAGRSGQLLNLSSLAADCGITHTTARRWVSILVTSFIITLLPPHHKNFNKRLVKASKLYFFDTGLLCYLMRIRKPEELMLHSSRGAIFESFVVSELCKKAIHSGLEPDIYFWRDSAGHEVDVIIDRGLELIPLEIKSGKTIAKDFFKGLRYWQNLSGIKDGPSALIYAGDRSLRQKGTSIYSWWNF